MRTDIIRLLKALEHEHNIRILFAVESGSRAWGMESKDSDYDVRFAFVRPLKDYVQLKLPPEVITKAYDEQGQPHEVEGSFIDMSGFDIFKYTRLLANSNPTTIEWLISPIVYYGEQNPALAQLALKEFNPQALYHHYKSLCEGNFTTYIRPQKKVTYKMYLYAYRGLLNALWVKKYQSVPPILFAETVEKLKADLPSSVSGELQRIITLKAQGNEKDTIQNISLLDNHITSFLHDATTPPSRIMDKEAINDELRAIVLNSVTNT